MLLAALVALAHAAGPTAKLSGETLPEWWAAPGRPGFVDDAHMGNGLTYHFLGLTAGGVGLRDELLPAFRPWPGLDELAAPLAWYDSAAVVVGEGGGWYGFGAPLAELHAIAAVPSERRPRAAFTFVNGSSSVDRTGLLLQRGGLNSWLRGGALTADRAGSGQLEQNGAHAWFLETGQRRGAHTFSGTFSQRGMAGGTRRDASLLSQRQAPPFIGFEEAAKGEAGALEWSWANADRVASARLERSHDHRESFESYSFAFPAEREAQDVGVVVEWGAGGTLHHRGLRLEARKAEVRRSADDLGDFVTFSKRPPVSNESRTVWLSGRGERPLWGGQLELEAGAGYVSAPALNSERVQAAPSLVWRSLVRGARVRVVGERLVQPVWSDLAVGTPAFVQDTWLAGLDLGLGRPDRQWLDVSLLGADIGARAHLQPSPVRDIALRYGWTAEPAHVQDGMVTLATGVRRGAHALDVSGFARVRPIGFQTAEQDPAIGARGGVETGFRVFAGDLGVRLRVEAAWVGERENVSLPEYFVRPRPLAGYATFGANLALTLGDARIVIRAANLEDEPRPQLWTDPVSPFPGTPAVGAGRQFRVELAWPFFN